MAAAATKSARLDRIDHQLVHALLIDGRAPFSLLAEVIGTSEQTVARRYRRLQDAGAARVLVLPAPSEGALDWIIRIGVRPGAAGKLATALAQRDDVSWLRIMAGGAEVLCISRPTSAVQREALLLERLARTSVATSVGAHAILKMFSDTWSGFDDPLEPDQVSALRAAAPARTDGSVDTDGRDGPPDGRAGSPDPHPEDDALYEALREDGRAGYAQLAAAAGISPARAARRLETLLATGQAYVHVDLATDPLGFPTAAALWLSVAPAELERVGERLGALASTTFVAAVTGPVNLTGSVLCRTEAELYSLLTDEIGAIDGIQSAEISPVMRRVKQAGTILRGPRLRL
jgi:DNA-binding Lrp family transcriptional regulator